MPRPKPPEPLIGRQVRMSDRHWMILQELGGAEWLRTLLDKKAPMPKKYYDARLNPPTGEPHAIRKQTTPLQERVRATARPRGATQAHGASEG
jgi:hypothetical protein